MSANSFTLLLARTQFLLCEVVSLAIHGISLLRCPCLLTSLPQHRLQGLDPATNHQLLKSQPGGDSLGFLLPNYQNTRKSTIPDTPLDCRLLIRRMTPHLTLIRFQMCIGSRLSFAIPRAGPMAD
ncbi:hypothetical protein EDB19DRAFT_746557 [Suillus lakei]|nr:hypothetical protein EDB19DRAFT_746557 [Suillus lakei]